MPQHESPVAEINEKVRHSPAILEIKPNIELKPHSHEAVYQPHKFNPSYEINHGLTHHTKPYYNFEAQPETFKPSLPSGNYKPGTVINIKHSPVPLKTVKLVSTPGLKHYATYPKLKISRNDYQNYFKKRDQTINDKNKSSEEFEDLNENFRPVKRPNLYRRFPRQ